MKLRKCAMPLGSSAAPVQHCPVLIPMCCLLLTCVPLPVLLLLLPQAEKLNGRAAMVGYFMALVVDQLTGYGLLDQQNSFLGKLLLHVTVFGILLIRTSSDLDKYKNLLDEATFYDKQWQATWTGVPRPSETEQ